MLDDLDHHVDQTDSKLSDAMRRMRKFVREIEGQYAAFNRGLTCLTWDRNEIRVVYRHPYRSPAHSSRRSHLGVNSRW